VTILQYGLLILVAALLPFALARWARTAAGSPERPARRDVALLLALIVLGLGGSLLRDWVLERFGVISIGYWACNLVLLGIAWMAALILRRLYRAYRRSAPSAGKPGTPTVSTPVIRSPIPSKDQTPKP